MLLTGGAQCGGSAVVMERAVAGPAGSVTANCLATGIAILTGVTYN